MKETALNVLSIDWDYFQSVSEKTVRECYPDGIDQNTQMSEIIWGAKYASFPEISDITVLEQEIKNIKTLLKNQKPNTPVMIANSHVHIYDFIQQHRDQKKINLTNIDMHHDIINDNEDMDCGNWIHHLIKNKCIQSPIAASFKWIHNPISFSMCGFGENDPDEFQKTIEKIDGGTEIKPIMDQQYNMIFLARSDIWSPPHLDFEFQKLIYTIAKHFNTVISEENIAKPRTEYKNIAKTISKTIGVRKW